MTRQRSDEQRKRQIRAAATRCFVARGYASTRLLDIAREAGLSKGGVYFHYRAKEQLFHDILDAHLETLHERWGFSPVTDKPAGETLERLVVAHLETIEAEPDETRLFNLLVTMAVQEPVFREKLGELFAIMRNLYAGVIERGMEAGEFVRGDVDAAATMVMSTINGFCALTASNPEGKLPIRPELIAGQLVAQVKNARQAVAATA